MEAESTFLEFVKRMAEQNQDLGPNPTASNYGPAVIARQTKGFRKAELEQAMQRLIDTNGIHIRLEGPPTKKTSLPARLHLSQDSRKESWTS